MPWYLGRVKESEPGSGTSYTYEGCREIPDDEMQRIQRSISLVVRLSTRAFLLPLFRAANDLRSELQEFQDNPAVRRDVDRQVDRAVALDYWLNALPLFNNRLCRETRLVLGADAEAALKARLKAAQIGSLALRISWLLRNAGQHALAPIDLLATSGRRADDGTVQWRTVLDVDKWRTLHGNDFPKQLDILPQTINFFGLITDTVLACELIFSQFLVDNAEPREAASKHITAVIGEALVHFDETSHVMVWQQEKGAGDSNNWQFLQLPWTHASEVLASTDAAREALGLPRERDEDGNPKT